MAGYTYVILVPLIPLVTFLLLGLFGRYLGRSSGMIGTAGLLAATLLSFLTAFQYFFGANHVNGVYEPISAFKHTWLQFSPGLSIDMGIMLDPISVMMIVVVTFIALMVHLFSLGYMKGEERFTTYYAFLSLFTFSMLGLVLSVNIFQVYMFWELVGVSSYLLIGFYFQKASAVAASKKAFIVTRFADFGFLIGILILGFYGGSLDIATLVERLTNTASPEFIAITAASFFGISVLTWALTLVFIGGAGKSAMFPLHVWLPDAMEGPTPVSALIHAATMVVAGVYLVARLFPIFSMNSAVLSLVTWVGVASALIAAIIACTQTDIKRVLAYSTMSQIGFMMFSQGLSKTSGEDGLGYMASMFHLFTHAFFKSLLFLCAGAVIHYVHSNEMRDMGGLRKLMPVTHACFLIACLAIAGIPPFAGFFSKEEILLTAWNENLFVYGIGLFTAAVTAFYMFRLYFSIFWSQPFPTHAKQPATAHQQEGSLTMQLPLVILALCTIAAGLVPFSKFVTADGRPLETHFNPLFSVPPVLLSIIAILVAAELFKHGDGRAANIAAGLGLVYKAASKKFYVDELYLFVTKKIIFPFAGRPAAWFDRNVVDGCINGLAYITASTSNAIRWVQSGRLQHYTLYFFGGIAGLAIIFIYLWK
ncbi:NADH-quinone oxidoreductase subunit L [Segetibacter sp. 3557_3]|uniref:NADH-quinone oxidoreductase subunit L n=1 Tax=Segetibacter sp. 3557_3 TaxID=2547429 RepID=UPI0010585693|nr:NADH-quinone oxidoreductase subunit L [Segetibacter sp. 3557_3]TDH29261.1 NADH-quinone oxidoreductase subunit L [Segetibacter sp. 3557_3]